MLLRKTLLRRRSKDRGTRQNSSRVSCISNHSRMVASKILCLLALLGLAGCVSSSCSSLGDGSQSNAPGRALHTGARDLTA